jgi:threonine dehydrogenase-like Zn-dependent dehydrogenase
MKALIYHGPGDLRLDDLASPDVGDTDVLIEIRAAGICATDLRIADRGHFKIPQGTRRVLGHELAGRIAAIGRQVTGMPPGMPVAVVPNLGCGLCDQCVRGRMHLCQDYEAFGITLDGGFAEYMRVPERAWRQGLLVPLPDGLGFEEAALVEPLSCCYNGLAAARVRPGDAVLVVGGGPIGLMHVLLARLAGARRVMLSEVLDERLAQAEAFGADVLINPDAVDIHAAVLGATDGRGADVVMVAAPSPQAMEQAPELASVEGRVVYFAGLPPGRDTIAFAPNRIHYRQITVTGTTGSSRWQFRRTLDLVAARRIDLSRLVSATVSLDDGLSAFDRARSRRELKVIISSNTGERR